VGDDDQSIYAFRGARVGNMADFVREFQVQHQIKLEQNYRSFSNILDSANQLISHNKTRLGKTLRTDQGAGEPVRVVESPSDFAEAQWLVEELRQLVKQDGFERKEIALLYRSNAQSRVLETALFNAGFPYRVYGGLRFFERAEIKHALAYLRLMENPNDDTSFLRVVNFPPRGIGARSIEQLQDAARAAGCSLHDAVSATTGKAGANLAAFVAMVDVLREQTEGMTLCWTKPVWSTTTAPKKKARTGWKTWKNWSTPPRALSRKKALAAVRWPCRRVCRKARPARVWAVQQTLTWAPLTSSAKTA